MKPRLLFKVLLLISFACGSNYALSLEKSFDTKLNEWYVEAQAQNLSDKYELIEWWKVMAAEDLAIPQYVLGLLFSDPRDEYYSERRAISWFRKSASNGLAHGSLELAILLANKREPTQADKLEIEQQLELAAASLDEAQALLGHLYLQGSVLKKNLKKANYWLEKGASKNNADALTGLGWLYFSGQAVEADDTKAIHYFQQAAMLGSPFSARQLASMYTTGEGADKSLFKAVYWLEIAVANGDTESNNTLADLQLRMPSEDFQTAQFKAQHCIKGEAEYCPQ